MDTLTDAEVAVVIDSLAFTRNSLRERHVGVATPNIDSALDKIESLIGPDSIGLRISRVEPANVNPKIKHVEREEM